MSQQLTDTVTQPQQITQTDRTCNRCGVTHPTTNFYILHRKSKSGQIISYPAPICKSCESQRKAASYKKRPTNLDKVPEDTRGAIKQDISAGISLSAISRKYNLPRHVIVYFRNTRLQ